MIITGGKYKSRKVFAPDENITRPTLSKVRMGVFNTLYSMLGDFGNMTFLDVFGGSGIMGLEAISRGFKNVAVYEKNLKAAQIIKKNYSILGLQPDLKIGDSLKIIEKQTDSYDVAYVDPPYMSGIYEEVFSLLEKKVSYIAAEHSADINIINFYLIKTKNYGGKKVSFYKSKFTPSNS